RNLVERVTCLARGPQVTRREMDLDGGGQQLGAKERIARLGDHPADRALRDVEPPLRKAQERQPRLRLAPMLASDLEAVLRRLERTQQAVDLPLLVAGVGAGGRIVRADQPTGLSGLLQRLRPGAADL